MDFLEEELEEILNIFREESEEQIQKINQNLLKLEENPENKDAIAELFREAHSIKGASRMIGLNDIQMVAHKMEDVFGLAKDKEIKVTPEIIDTLCNSIDCISSIIEESIASKGISHSPLVDDILKQLEAIENNKGVVAQKGEDVTPEVQEELNIKEQKALSAEKVEIIDKVNDILLEVFKCLNTLKLNTRDAASVSKLQKLITNIDVISEALNNETISENIIALKIKLDWVTKGSGILLEVELIEIIELANNFIAALKLIAEPLGYKIAEQSEEVCEPDNKTPKEEEEEPELELEIDAPTENLTNNKLNFNTDLNKSISLINANIDNIDDYKNGPNSCDIIFENIQYIKEQIDNEQILQIYELINQIIENISKSSTKPDKDFLAIIKQSAESTGEILTDPESVSLEDPNLILQRLSILGEMLELSTGPINAKSQSGDDKNYTPTNKKSELVVKEEFQKKSQDQYKFSEPSAIKTLRVDTRKLDQLVNQVGELIIAKIKTKQHLSEIEQISRSIEEWHRDWGKSKQYLKYMDRKNIFDKSSQEYGSASQKNVYSLFEYCTEKITDYMNNMNTLYRTVQEDDARLNLIVNELEQMIKSVRVLPFATVFHMFPRMVRDISRTKGKQIELVIAGSETSADKKIIEDIKSPLTHIIRNAIDHGIETPDERIAKGKSATGKIFLSAHHLENSVLIEVIDDGSGIDIDKIKAKVIKKGLLSHTELEAMTESQIMNIVFWPGFSTGDAITDISGRGVGLDVVHTKINQLNGKVNITSRLNEGCKVSIKLPVTMATIKSFLVSVNGQTFAIPASAICNAFVVKPEEIFLKEGKSSIIYNDNSIPVFKLSDILGLPNNIANEDKQIVLIIQSEDAQIALIINKLIGEHEILHKNLSAPLVRVRNIAGVTALGSGELCLILNISDIVKSAYAHKEMLTVKELVVNANNSFNSTKKILIVDDSVTTRILERNILKAAGYKVEVAVNGLDALTKVAAEKFDLVVSDVEMPEVNGIELTKRLKSDDVYSKTPIILVTSLAKEADKKKGFDAGANAYITKGAFSQNDLLFTVKELLKE